MIPTFNALLNFIISVISTVCYFLVGWFWSASTWRVHFDLGWLLVAYLFARYAAQRIAMGKIKGRDYATIWMFAAPGFGLEAFADWGLHDFQQHGGSAPLLRFALFSAGLLFFVVAVTAVPKFGVELDELSKKDEGIWRSVVRIGASALAISIAIGTIFIFLRTTAGSGVQAGMLKLWFYSMSLAVYFLLIMKMMLPLILNRSRAAFDQRETRF